MSALEDRIREVVKNHGRFAQPIEDLANDTDLFAAGLTSHASMEVMLALESELGIVFPDRMLTRTVFETITSIAAAASELLSDAK